MLKKEGNQYLFELLLLFSVYIFLLPLGGHWGDVEYWESWAVFIFRNGIENAYRSEINYPPVFLYLLSLYNFIQGTEEKIIRNIHYLKIISLLFDFLPVIFILFNRNFIQPNARYFYFLLFNIAYLYNSVLWGQIDSVHSSLSLISIIIANTNPFVSIAIYVIALNTKFQAIIFFPVLILIIIRKLKKANHIFGIFLILIISQGVILLPFFLSGTLADFLKVINDSIDYFPYVSASAFNFWYLFIPNAIQFNDNTEWIILSYKHAGLLMFSLFSVIVLLPLLLNTITCLIRKINIDDKIQGIIFLSGGLLSVAFFFFNTQMHERYVHPAMIFFFFYGWVSKRFGLYALISVAYFLHLEKILQYLPIAHYTFIFEPQFIAFLFLVILVYGISIIIKDYPWNENIKIVKEFIFR